MSSANDVPLAFDPKSTWLFMVSIIDDPKWEKDRNAIGEVRVLQMFEALLDADRIVFVTDEQATRTNAQAELVQMLKQQQKTGSDPHSDTLIFYYGGHGCKGYFCTNEDPWYHSEVVQTIEEYFWGNQVWVFADCCFSGTLAHQFTCSKYEFSKSYLCFMSTQAHLEARDEWVMTRCLVDVMDGNNRNPNQGNGKKSWTLESVVSYIADEAARTTKDCFTIYEHGNQIRPQFEFPRVPPELVPPIRESVAKKLLGFCCSAGCSVGTNNINSTTSWKGIDSCNVDDVVYAKWNGGLTERDGRYAFPVWFRGRVLSSNEGENTARIELSDHFIESYKWCTTVSVQELLSETHFDWDDSDSESSSVAETVRAKACIQAHVEFAKHLKYLTFTDFSSGATVKVLWNDDILYDATIMDETEVNWERLRNDEPRPEFKDMTGAFVPVKWHGEDTWDVVPLGYCLEKNSALTGPQLRLQAQEQGALAILSPKDAIMRGIAAAGKSVALSTESILGSKKLSCLCIDREEWGPATAANLQDIPFESLAHHLYFIERGEYCGVQWDNDGTTSYTVLPIKFVQPRSCKLASKACVETHIAFAKQLKYISFRSILPGTRVQVLWSDNAFYGATVMDENQVYWEKPHLGEPQSEFQKMVGAFVPVRWDDPGAEEKKWVFMPLSYCIVESGLAIKKPAMPGRLFRKQAHIQSERDALDIRTPKDAIFKGLLSANKTVCPSTESFVGRQTLSCFSQDKNEWIPANAADLQDLSCEELAQHLSYDDQGEYCAIRWGEESATSSRATKRCSLLPMKYVRRW